MDKSLDEKPLVDLIRELDLVAFHVGYIEGTRKDSSILTNRRYELFSNITKRLQKLDDNLQNLKELLNINV